MLKITDNIEYLPSSNEPLSADVYVIRGAKNNYIIDTGSNDEAFKIIEGIKNKIIIITHFHADHIGNLSRIDIPDANLYVGKYTKDYCKCGTEILDSITIEDGANIRISAIPSSHAKGSLAITVDNKWLFLGDSYYCSAKGYNVSLLHDEMEFLKNEPFEYAILSHDENRYSKKEILDNLKAIYSSRSKNEPYIKLEH